MRESSKFLTISLIILLSLVCFPIEISSGSIQVQPQTDLNQGTWCIDLKFLNPPLLNKPSTLVVVATPTANALGAKLVLSIPDSFTTLSGNLQWSGEVLKSETKTLEAVVKSTTVGTFTINAYVVNSVDGAVFGAMKALQIEIGEKTSTVKELDSNPAQEGKQLAETKVVVGGGNSITVKGRLTFAGGSMAIKGAEVEVFDSDGLLGAQSMGKTQTNDNGEFELKNLANPFDVLEFFDGPDIFVMVYARNWVVDLRNNPWWLLGSTYSYKTGVIQNVGEHDLVDFQTVSCQAEQDKAWDIYNVLQASYWFLNDKTGESAPQVKAFYKDLLTPFRSYCFSKSLPEYAFITSLIPGNVIGLGLNVLLPDIVGVHYAESDLTDDYAWSHHVITHEYGHYVTDTFAEMTPPMTVMDHKYDESYDKDHAFVEGWAHFFSAAQRQWWGAPATEYRDDPPIERNLEGDSVEGAVAGVLWDIYDSENDIGDTLQLDFSAIWNVLTTYDPDMMGVWPIGKDHPWNIYDFWDGFRIANAGEPTAKLVPILTAHKIEIPDEHYPTKPTGFKINSIHQIGVVSPIQRVSLEWSGADDPDTHTIKDYLVYWVNYPPRDIPKYGWAQGDATNSNCYIVGDANNIGSTTKTLSKGEWWVEIRCRDLSENPNSDGTFDVGPFCIGDPLVPLTTIQFSSAPSPDLSLYVYPATVLTFDTVPVQGEPISQTSSYYRIYGGFNQYDSGLQLYSTPIDFSTLPTSGDLAIEYFSQDTAGHIETHSTVNVILDKIPPTSHISVGQPQYQATTGRTPLYVTAQTPFTISANDLAKGIGVDYTKYRIINGLFNNVYDSGWQTYTGPFTLSTFIDNFGFTTIEYYSVDKAGNIEETKRIPVVLDNSKPSVRMNPTSELALQDNVNFEISGYDTGSGIDTTSATLSILRVTTEGLQPTAFSDLQLTYDSTTKTWKLNFDTLQLLDGNYELRLTCKDKIGNSATETTLYDIANSPKATEMLPQTENSKAGRTMPIKFTLRVDAATDPDQPFIYNQKLTICIYKKGDGNILQQSTYGTKSTDYRIDTTNQFYITNFQTSKTPTEYTVKIFKGTNLIATLEFATQK